MEKPSDLSNLGIYAYAAGAIALGIIGLISGDFAGGWQRVQPGVPLRSALALIVAVWELAGGVLLLRRKTAPIGAAMLTPIYCIFVLLWVPPIISAPAVYDSWGNFFEELSLVIAGITLFVALSPGGSRWHGKAKQVSRFYGICTISFGLDHLIYLKGAAAYVPKWIPGGGVFWVAATAVFFLMAAAALFSGILAGLATRLLTIMIFAFQAFIWIPVLCAGPHAHFSWAANGIALALGGGAWVIADAQKAVPNGR
jgi:hypothetical protein